MQMVSGSQKGLPEPLLRAIGQYRRQIFVEQLGWPLTCHDGMEADQFDRPDTLYIAAHNEQGAVQGCARLLPTTGPYLLADVFPELLDGATPPCSPAIWELSRFAASGPSAQGALRQFSASFTVQLLRTAITCAREQGAEWLISVSPAGIERLLRHGGVPAMRAGPVRQINGHQLFACWIACQHRATASAAAGIPFVASDAGMIAAES